MIRQVIQAVTVEGKDVVLRLIAPNGAQVGERVYKGLAPYVQATKPTDNGDVLVIVLPVRAALEVEVG
jgi:hypothetical protein